MMPTCSVSAAEAYIDRISISARATVRQRDADVGEVA